MWQSGGTTTYTLIYRAGTGGTIDGATTQEVAAGESGTAVSAGVEDAAATFAHWSDGLATATRTDSNVQSDLTVQAAFHSTDGASLDWYTAHGIAPESGETWADVDDRPVPAKGTTLLHENIADTDPSDTNDVFRFLMIDPGPPSTVQFRPGSTARDYTLQATTNLTGGVWTNVPGQGPRPGEGESDTMIDTNTAPASK